MLLDIILGAGEHQGIQDRPLQERGGDFPGKTGNDFYIRATTMAAAVGMEDSLIKTLGR